MKNVPLLLSLPYLTPKEDNKIYVPICKLFIEEFSDWLFSLLYGGGKSFGQNFWFFNQQLVKMVCGKFCLVL